MLKRSTRQYFNFECYCENAQIVGFSDFKYSTLLGATRRLVFFWVCHCSWTLVPPVVTHAHLLGPCEGLGLPNPKGAATPLLRPSDQRARGRPWCRTSLHFPPVLWSPKGTILQRGPLPGTRAPQEVGRRAGECTLNPTPAYSSPAAWRRANHAHGMDTVPSVLRPSRCLGDHLPAPLWNHVCSCRKAVREWSDLSFMRCMWLLNLASTKLTIFFSSRRDTIAELQVLPTSNIKVGGHGGENKAVPNTSFWE